MMLWPPIFPALREEVNLDGWLCFSTATPCMYFLRCLGHEKISVGNSHLFSVGCKMIVIVSAYSESHSLPLPVTIVKCSDLIFLHWLLLLCTSVLQWRNISAEEIGKISGSLHAHVSTLPCIELEYCYLYRIRIRPGTNTPSVLKKNNVLGFKICSKRMTFS
jgi:hypothetical protein